MNWIDGVALLVQPEVFLFVLAGSAVGLLLGALPGLDITTAVALLLPLTYLVDANQALVFFSGMYASGVFAGSITGILFRIPGSAEAVMTAVEGHAFTRRGEAGLALGLALYSSAIGGTLACVALFTLTPLLADIALSFGPSEYFAVGVLGLAAVATATGADAVKGVVATLLGLLLATVGIDPITGVPRFDFGFNILFGGVPFVPAIIGLFAAAEIFRRIAAGRENVAAAGAPPGGVLRVVLPKLAAVARMRWTILRSSLLGLWIGLLPGAGATAASIVAYGTETRLSDDPDGFGKGKPEGVAAPEAANNAAAVGAMIPLLALGVPGSATTAVLIGAFLIHGLQPGPFLFADNGALVYAIFGGLAVSNVLIIVLGRHFAGLFARLAFVPLSFLAVSILSVCVLGALSFGGTRGAAVMLAFAVLGLALEAARYPAAGVVIGLVLGPIVERSLRRALLLANFDLGAVLTRPVTAVLLVLSLLFFLSPLSRKLRESGSVDGRVRSAAS